MIPAHEADLGQRLSGGFEFLQIIEGEIRACRIRVEALVANLDHTHNRALPVEHRSRLSFWMVAGRSSSPLAPVDLTVSKMLACSTPVKLLNNSTFLVTAVWAATALELEIGIVPAVRFNGKEKPEQSILQAEQGDFVDLHPKDFGQCGTALSGTAYIPELAFPCLVADAGAAAAHDYSVPKFYYLAPWLAITTSAQKQVFSSLKLTNKSHPIQLPRIVKVASGVDLLRKFFLPPQFSCPLISCSLAYCTCFYCQGQMPLHLFTEHRCSPSSGILFGGQSRAVSAAAVKHERRIQARDNILDVTLNDGPCRR